jgi:hypothetical protein
MNLLGQNIGQNYRGILNLGSTINSPLSTTLQAVTDGMGNNSPLQLSTTQVAVVGGLFRASRATATGAIAQFNDGSGIGLVITMNGSRVALSQVLDGTGIYTPTLSLTGDRNVGIAIGNADASARLHVRGDGTNPILRLENGAGSVVSSIDNSGNFYSPRINLTTTGNTDIGNAIYTTGTGLIHFGTIAYGSNYHSVMNVGQPGFDFSQAQVQILGGEDYFFRISKTFRNNLAPHTQNQNYKPFNLLYTINNGLTSTGTATGIFLNATETALNGMGHNLLDLQVGGVSRFSLNSLNRFTFGTQSGSIWNIVFDLGAGTNPGGYLHWKLANDANNYFSMYQQGGKMQFFNQGSGYGQGMVFSTNGINRLEISSGGLLQLGGTTNAFPAIKRNGAAIDFRLADDVSGFCDVNALSFRAMGSAHSIFYTSTGNGSEVLINSTGFGPILRSAAGTSTWGQWGSDQIHLVGSGGAANRIGYNLVLQAGISTGNVNGGDIVFRGNPTNGVNGSSALNTIETLALIKNTGAFVLGTTSPNASAILQADSTSRGFLPPRMTTAEINLIATPADGLIVYNTTIGHLCVRAAGVWHKLSQSTM